MILMRGTTYHLQVIWEVEILGLSLSNPTSINGKILAFSQDVVSGTTTSTIQVDTTWWVI